MSEADGNRRPGAPTPAKGTGLGDAFDAAVRGLEGIPDVVKTVPTTRRCIATFSGVTETFVVQTYRHPERGDTILVEHFAAGGLFRLALPPEVADVVARQRRILAAKSRKRGAQRALETKAERGIEPPPQFRKRRTES